MEEAKNFLEDCKTDLNYSLGFKIIDGKYNRLIARKDNIDIEINIIEHKDNL